MRVERLIRDEEGFTTAGMAIALLVTLSLLFSTAQVYRINTAAAQVQDVADACALAAENEVAEFMVAVRLCDSVVLTMSLLGIVCYGLGVVCLCVPAAAEIGGKLISAGQKVLDAKDTFSQKASETLDELQEALPYLAAANACAVAAANSQNQSCSYYAVAMLVPSDVDNVDIDSNDAEDALESQVNDKKDDIADAAKRAEEAAEAANAAKQRSFASDCGEYPAYCLYERAAHLAGLGSRDNPFYHSADTWSFSVPLQRAHAYYRARYVNETPEGSSVEEQANSVLRKRFYAYAIDVMNTGYVHETATSFDAYFPRLPRNTDQMRTTSLFSDPIYPVTQEGESNPVMHAWDDCPNASGATVHEAVSALEGGEYDVCSLCQFKASSLGKIAAASTSISNGFEYHYNAVADAAEDYERAVREAQPLIAEVKGETQSLFGQVVEAINGAASSRIDVCPPGANGCIALVVSPENVDAGGFESSFVASDSTLGARAAVSASTLLEDSTDDSSVIADLLSGFEVNGAVGSGVGNMIMGCWSALLKTYENGQNSLVAAVESVLNELPLVGAAGLGTWAAKAIRDNLEQVGLEPAKDKPLKPVLVNSSAVSSSSDDDFAVRFTAVKEAALATPSSSTSVFASLVEDIRSNAYDALASEEIEIARIELPVGGVNIPVTVTLPPAVVSGAEGLVDRACTAVRSVAGSVGIGRVWE